MQSNLPKKSLFDIPEGVIYLDGNSLGPTPKGVAERAAKTIQEEWGRDLIKAWNTAGWMALPAVVGDKIAALIGAEAGSVATGDTLSIKVYQALAAAFKMRPDRRVVVSDNGNFPTDLYMAQGLMDTIDKGYQLRTPAPQDVMEAITEDTAAVLLTQVDYRTGRLHDMAAITAKAHEVGAVMIWDLAHSAGAMPIDIAASGAEFAVGCTYKYLNGGPGAPAFIYARPDIVEEIEPALAGWLGHDAPFAMEPTYRPAMKAERLRVGTPSILQLTVLDQALSVWEGVDLADIRAASMALSDLFIELVEANCPALTLASPRDANERGSQVSFAFEHGYPAMQALIERGVIGDFREPNIMRFGFTPLYLDSADVRQAEKVLSEIINKGLWQDEKYNQRGRVT
ncbi:kynureninase [Alphaproteobacteria bacterium KMM 3653]|uniref:Kynureninase n=1 Tax=Harenicola maris TaxID=2841044 RepID=A0AAP2CPZ4_9RHOB|nr:kynureninase [Harenicola maris]